MRLTRLYSPDMIFQQGTMVPLNEDQAHYILRVLRMENDAQLVMFNETSGAWQGSLVVAGKKGVVTLNKQIQEPCPPRDIQLLVSPLKKEVWGFCLEKATELDVAAIQPVIMDHTQSPRVNDARDKANLIEASQQSERTHVPHYLKMEKLDRVLSTWDAGRILFVALERSDAVSLPEVFKQENPEKSAILIGPEGGFSQRERDLLVSKKFVRVFSLGHTILRAETAAIAALAQVVVL